MQGIAVSTACQMDDVRQQLDRVDLRPILLLMKGELEFEGFVPGNLLTGNKCRDPRRLNTSRPRQPLFGLPARGLERNAAFGQLRPLANVQRLGQKMSQG